MKVQNRKANMLLALSVVAIAISAPVARAQQVTSSTAGQDAAPTPTQQDKGSQFITFTPIQRGIGPSPQATFGCSLPSPTVNVAFATHTASWTGNISCSISVGLYGTTVLFNVPGNVIYAYGNQINTNASSASSSGTRGGLPGGNYAVNFNIDITPPAGYTTTAGGNCSYINGGPAIHCSVGSGTFNVPN